MLPITEVQIPSSSHGPWFPLLESKLTYSELQEFEGLPLHDALQQPWPRALLPGHCPPSLVPRYPASLPQLRDAAAVCIFAGSINPEAEHQSELHVHTRMTVTWLVTQTASAKMLLSAAPTHGTYVT